VPIRIVRDTERFTATLDGGGILYWRRLPSHVRQECQHRHTVRGVLDQTAAFDAMLTYAVVGWDQVIDADGTPLAFAPELVRLLPEDVKLHLVQLFGLADPGEQALLGNSNGTSPVRLH
jgi:hypothetical protein